MSDARDRTETRDLIETGVEMGSVSCGCSLAIGLMILGSCAGVATATKPGTGCDMNVYVPIISAIAIVAFVYVIARKNAKLKAARKELAEMSRRTSAAAEMSSADDTGSR